MSEEATYLNEDGTARLSRLVSYFESSERSTSTSRKLSERDRDYYDNTDDSQWTDAEKTALKKRKQPITTSNRIKSKINYLLGVEMARRSLPKAYPRTPKDQGSADAATDGLRFVIEDNRYDRTRSAAFKNMAIEGYCGCDVSVRQVGNDIKISIDPIQWDRLFFDDHSRNSDFNDGKYRGQVIWLDAEDAEQEFPGSAAVINATFASEAGMSDTYEDSPRLRWADTKRKRVRIVELWHQERGIYYHCVFTKGGIISEMKSPYVDEEGNSIPGIVMESCFVDREGNRYGVARDWISIQDEINKRRSKALHLLSVRQTMGEKGAVDDVNKARAEMARPDGHVEVNPTMKFEVLPTGDMASAQFQLLAEAKGEIDSIGVNAAMSGSETRVMSGRALMKREESGLSELGPVFDALKQFDHSIYRAVWCRIKQFWTAEKWIRITDDEKSVKFVGLNVPMTLGQQLLEEAQQQGMDITPDMEMQAKHDPEMQQIVGTKNNVAEMDVDIVVDDTPASASLQAEQFEVLADLAKAGMPIPPEAIIQASNLRNKDALIKSMKGNGDLPPQVKQQMEQMQGQIQEMGKALQEAEADRSLEERKLELEARKVEIEAYRAESERLKDTAAAMMPEQIQAIVTQTVMQVLQSPDVLPPRAEMPEPMMAQMAPPQNEEHPPMPEEIQPEPGQDPGFFTPNEMQAPPDMQGEMQQ